jgi:hypothetical protein
LIERDPERFAQLEIEVAKLKLPGSVTTHIYNDSFDTVFGGILLATQSSAPFYGRAQHR